MEIAHTQYYGWALRNRAALLPTRAQLDKAIEVVAAAEKRLVGRIRIDSVVPDYYARFPKACMGGWGRRLMLINPTGKVLPCHAAEVIPGMTFENVRERSLEEIWRKRFGGSLHRSINFGVKSGCQSHAAAASGGVRISAGAVARRFC
jgi:pyrroloquinoline quinone biosynthesis protein E